MRFDDMKTELAARGFDYLSDTRLGQYINWALQELGEAEDWPLRRILDTGTFPLTYSDSSGMGRIASVYDDSATPRRRLEPANQDWLEEQFGDLRTTGTPLYYYLTRTTTGSLVVSTYPASTGACRLYYYQLPFTLSNAFDTPTVIPSRWHRLILDIAVRMAYRDADNHQAAEAMQAQIERDLWQMRAALLVEGDGGPDTYVLTTEYW